MIEERSKSRSWVGLMRSAYEDRSTGILPTRLMNDDDDDDDDENVMDTISSLYELFSIKFSCLCKIGSSCSVSCEAKLFTSKFWEYYFLIDMIDRVRQTPAMQLSDGSPVTERSACLFVGPGSKRCSYECAVLTSVHKTMPSSAHEYSNGLQKVNFKKTGNMHALQLCIGPLRHYGIFTIYELKFDSFNIFKKLQKL